MRPRRDFYSQHCRALESSIHGAALPPDRLVRIELLMLHHVCCGRAIPADVNPDGDCVETSFL